MRRNVQRTGADADAEQSAYLYAECIPSLKEIQAEGSEDILKYYFKIISNIAYVGIVYFWFSIMHIDVRVKAISEE